MHIGDYHNSNGLGFDPRYGRAALPSPAIQPCSSEGRVPRYLGRLLVQVQPWLMGCCTLMSSSPNTKSATGTPERRGDLTSSAQTFRSAFLIRAKGWNSMKSNAHKKLYRMDKFARKFYCKHARLNQLRSDKHLAKVKARRNNSREMRTEEW